MDIPPFRKSAEESLDPELEELARRVIGAAIEVHRIIGPGMPENVYEKALSIELTLQHIPHECQVRVPVNYKGQQVGEGCIDILVDSRLVLELKSIQALADVHKAQVVAYLQATKLMLGLLINFNVAILKDGIRRIINSNKPKNSSRFLRAFATSRLP